MKEEEISYKERMAGIAKMLKDCLEKNGFVLHINSLETSSSVGYDADIYFCEKDRYVAEFGSEEIGE